MLSLAAPWALLLLPLPLLIWRFAPPRHQRSSALRVPFFRRVTDAAGVTPRAGSSIPAHSRRQLILTGLIWALIVLGLARPERLGDPIVIEKAARDVVLALDISGSMDQRDFAGPDGQPQQRLAAVKDVIRQFLADRDGDRIALIVFGSGAFVQAPFTEDLQSLSGFLDQTVAGMAGPKTALGDAIGLAIRTFEASEVDQRLMILLSDGTDTASAVPPANAAAIAESKEVEIHTIAVGDPDATGEDRVDVNALQQIASTTGGAFFFADDTTALAEVYDRIDAQTPREVETTSFRPALSLGHWPMGAALVLMALGALGLRRARA